MAQSVACPVDRGDDIVATSPVRIGVFAIGLAAYWPQYPGLREGIEANLARVRERVSQAEVIDGGMVDSAQAGAALGDRFAAERVDLTFCFVGTYATSTQVMPVAQRSRVPMVLLNLQPVATIDYATADTAVMLANVGLCAVPEIAGVLVRSGMPHGLITGHLEDDAIWPDLHGWVKAARAAKAVRTGRFGMLGHTYPGMLDMSTDVERVSASLGTHIEILEIDDLKDHVIAITANEISDRLQALRREFELVGEIGDEAMTFSAQVAVALERLVADFTLDGLAYFYRGTGGDLNERIAASMIVGNTQLTARGIPAAGEGDLKTVIAMKILHELGGVLRVLRDGFRREPLRHGSRRAVPPARRRGNRPAQAPGDLPRQGRRWPLRGDAGRVGSRDDTRPHADGGWTIEAAGRGGGEPAGAGLPDWQFQPSPALR
jgi:L-arabinose isomerase